ncbi:hypothetical protein [Zymomonas mobilis]|uniref:hypothetical protein n=1 Tax=Zymomonas mobilis TaxID=542 RepID=UPI0011714694|nr:hypothetical protein [Zymomonas mobilis]MDX5949579.1 hypothetical protein [Zymomonas mobilis subsp. pomaceae]GEB90132.1 hypothetical protein ZMO02_17690 [Zymomonas mobilis subsp. pomaceae]
MKEVITKIINQMPFSREHPQLTKGTLQLTFQRSVQEHKVFQSLSESSQIIEAEVVPK